MARAHQAQPHIELELDKPRKFALTLGGIMRLEEELEKERGEPVSVFQAFNWTAIRAKDLVYLFYAGLVEDDPSLTLDKVKSIINVFSIIRARHTIAEGVKRAFPEFGAEVDGIVNPTKQTKGKKAA